MIVSVSSNTVNPYAVRFTAERCDKPEYGFRVGVEVNGIEVANLFDVPRLALEQLESAIRAALIDTETMDIAEEMGPPGNFTVLARLAPGGEERSLGKFFQLPDAKACANAAVAPGTFAEAHVYNATGNAVYDVYSDRYPQQPSKEA